MNVYDNHVKMWSQIILICFLMITEGRSATCRPPHMSNIPTGDINIALLYDLHGSTSGVTCKDVNPTSFQELEAFRYVFDQLNRVNYIPDVRLGTVVYDTCGRPDVAAQQVRNLLVNLDHRYNCEQCDAGNHANDGMTKRISCSDNNTSPLIFGIAGPATSEAARAVANILQEETQDNQLTQISHSATAALLTTDDKFANVFSVVPPDSFQAQVIVNILRRLEWNYIALIYTDDTYGRQGAEALTELAALYDICIPFLEMLPSHSLDKIKVRYALDRIDGVIGQIKQPASGVVYFGNANNAEEILRQRHEDANSRKIRFIFSDSFVMRPDVMRTYQTVAFDSLFVAPAYQNLSNVTTHWENLLTNNVYASQVGGTNPWLKELYNVYFNCSSVSMCPMRTSTQIGSLTTPSPFTYYSTQVAFIYAKLIKSLHSELCEDKPGLCTPLAQVPRTIIRDKVSRLSINFGLDFDSAVVPNELGRYPTVSFKGSRTLLSNRQDLYYIHQFQEECKCMKKVGSYSHNKLHLVGTNLSRKAVCRHGEACEYCIPSDSDKASRWIYYKPGDVIIVGLVPVNNAGSQPLSCGSLRLFKGFQLAEALIYAVEKVNRKQGIFSLIFPQNVTVGLLIMNTCINDAHTRGEIYSAISGKDRTFPIEFDVHGKSNIIGFVGPLSSDVSKALALLLTKTKTVQISYASTSVTLSDRQEFPYFLRTCSPDDTQAAIIIQVLKELHWDYVSVVYVDDAYGSAGFAVLKQLAAANEICIASSMGVDASTNFFSVLDELRKFPSARAVVLFVRLTMATEMLKAFSAKQNFYRGEFVFFLTESVGNRESFIRDNPAALGAISLLQDVALDEDFDQYLTTKNVDSSGLIEQFWLQEYLESFLECYVPLGFNKSSAKPCVPGVNWTDSHKYAQDPWAPFAINAVYSLVLGADKSLKDLCGESQGICDDFRDGPEQIISRIKETQLDLFHSGNVSPVFDDDGNGRVRFKIFNVQPSPSNPGTLRYVKVGHSMNPISGQTVQLTKALLRFPDSTGIPMSQCPNSIECSRCQTSTNPESPEPASYKTMLLAICAILGVVLLICAILLLLVCRKYKRLVQKQGQDTSPPDWQSSNYDYVLPTVLPSSRPPIQLPHNRPPTEYDVTENSTTENSDSTHPREEPGEAHYHNNVDNYRNNVDRRLQSLNQLPIFRSNTGEMLDNATVQTMLTGHRHLPIQNPTWEDDETMIRIL